MVKILAAFGIRPEAIKMVPVIHPLDDNFDVKIFISASHRQMLDQALDLFGIEPNYDLDIIQLALAKVGIILQLTHTSFKSMDLSLLSRKQVLETSAVRF